MGETLIVCPCWFIAIERLYWNFKLSCTTFFSKMCASKFGVRLIYRCGLYMDVYGKFVHFLDGVENDIFKVTV